MCNIETKQDEKYREAYTLQETMGSLAMDDCKLSHPSGTGLASASSQEKGLHYLSWVHQYLLPREDILSWLLCLSPDSYSLCTWHLAEGVLASKPFFSLLVDTPMAVHSSFCLQQHNKDRDHCWSFNIMDHAGQ